MTETGNGLAADTALARWLRAAMAGEQPALSAALVAELPNLDGDALAELAWRHRVAPWVLAAIEAAGATPPRALASAAARQTLDTLGHFGELCRLLTWTNEQRIDVVVLKGASVAAAYYPRAEQRPYGDLDLLIRERDLPQLSARLEEDGYRLYYPERERLHHEHGLWQRTFLHPERREVVELHCDHLQIGLEPVAMDEVWERARKMRFGTATAAAVEPHDLFVQLAVHLHRHGFDRLIWFKDLDLMVRGEQLDWDAVRERAEREGCRDSVSTTLELLVAMLGTPLPAGARALVAERSRLARWLTRRVWEPERLIELEDARPLRLRRLVQFSPESGLLRGGLPAFLTTGRRGAKARVMLAGLMRPLRRAA